MLAQASSTTEKPPVVDACGLESRRLYSASPLGPQPFGDSTFDDSFEDSVPTDISTWLPSPFQLSNETLEVEFLKAGATDFDTILEETAFRLEPSSGIDDLLMHDSAAGSLPIAELPWLNDFGRESTEGDESDLLDGSVSAISRFDESTIIISRIDTLSLHDDLDRVHESLNEHYLSTTTIIGTTIATAVFSLAYVLWTSRSNYLVSSLLAVTPAWTQVDPLPILEFAEADEGVQDGDRPILDLVRVFDRTI